MSLTTPCTSGTTFCGSPFISVSRRTLSAALGPVGRLAAGRGQLELDPAPIGRDRHAPDQPGLLEAIDQRGQRGPAHPDRRRQLARALRTVGRRDEQPVLRQADARGLAGLLRHASQAREEPDAFSEVAPGMRHFESVDMGMGNRCCVCAHKSLQISRYSARIICQARRSDYLSDREILRFPNYFGPE